MTIELRLYRHSEQERRRTNHVEEQLTKNQVFHFHHLFVDINC